MIEVDRLKYNLATWERVGPKGNKIYNLVLRSTVSTKLVVYGHIEQYEYDRITGYRWSARLPEELCHHMGDTKYIGPTGVAPNPDIAAHIIETILLSVRVLFMDDDGDLGWRITLE